MARAIALLPEISWRYINGSLDEPGRPVDPPAAFLPRRRRRYHGGPAWLWLAAWVV
jgi:hypothetical protein